MSIKIFISSLFCTFSSKNVISCTYIVYRVQTIINLQVKTTIFEISINSENNFLSNTMFLDNTTDIIFATEFSLVSDVLLTRLRHLVSNIRIVYITVIMI